MFLLQIILESSPAGTLLMPLCMDSSLRPSQVGAKAEGVELPGKYRHEGNICTAALHAIRSQLH